MAKTSSQSGFSKMDAAARGQENKDTGSAVPDTADTRHMNEKGGMDGMERDRVSSIPESQ